MSRAVGLEVTLYTLSFDPAKATRPIDFVLQRLCDGRNADPLLGPLFEGVREIRRRGAYQYMLSAVAWQKQADLFLKLREGRGFLFSCLDWESKYNTIDHGFASSAIEWMKYVSAATKQPVLIYTNQALYFEFAGYDARVKDWPLHLAMWYNDRPDPQVKSPLMPKNRVKTDWELWQYWAGEHMQKDEAAQLGCGNGVEIDVFNGTPKDMDAWLGLQPGTPPVPVIPPIAVVDEHKAGRIEALTQVRDYAQGLLDQESLK